MFPTLLREWMSPSRSGSAAGRRIKGSPTFREQERAGELQRAHYAYGLLRAADIARYFGRKETTVCEFGVATGGGLLNMISLAEQLSVESGVRFRIVGFDTGHGLPEPQGYKDHPEIWSAGDYPMQSDEELARRIRGRAELVLGDVKDTVESFLATLDAAAPLGFIAVDVDVYTSTTHALRCLSGRPELYNPAISMYFDDVAHFFANRWCGELAALREFNDGHEFRKIDHDRTQRHGQPRPTGAGDDPVFRTANPQKWFQRMYVCHVLDHPARNTPDSDRPRKVSVGGNFPPGVID